MVLPPSQTLAIPVITGVTTDPVVIVIGVDTTVVQPSALTARTV